MNVVFVPGQSEIRFDGADYVPGRDNPRLQGQILRVWQAMVDGKWHTLEELTSLTGDPTPSISAQLRHLRKPRFGGHCVERRYLDAGVYEYRLIPRTT